MDVEQEQLHPIRLEPSLHETIWGGHGLERNGWKQFPSGSASIGESWETEVHCVAQNEPYTNKTLGELTEELGSALLGKQTIATYGHRFPLLAKFLDANAMLSVQVHPDDVYVAEHTRGRLGKTECWYILAADPNAVIIHGFNAPTSQAHVRQAIQDVTLDSLLQDVPVQAGDVIFVPAGTVHTIGQGIILYELQEYSDTTYRIYDYGRLMATGMPRELHIEQSLDVAYYGVSPKVKMTPVPLIDGSGYAMRCLVACRYFVMCEIALEQGGYMTGKTEESCVILTALGTTGTVHYGTSLACCVSLSRGQTMILPAALGSYAIEGTGALMFSYVPSSDDEAWKLWRAKNTEYSHI